MTEITKKEICYVYAYCDPNELGSWKFEDIELKFKPFYIGKGKRSRKQTHLIEANRAIRDEAIITNRKQRKIVKLLKKNQKPIIIVLRKNLSEEDSYDLEKRIVDHFKRIDFTDGILYNYKGGGSDYFEVSPETKAKMRVAKLGKKLSPEHAAKLKETSQRTGKQRGETLKANETWLANVRANNATHKGRPSWNKDKSGYKRTVTEEEHIKKAEMCRNNFSGPKSEEHKRKLSVSVSKIARKGKDNQSARIVSEFDLEMNFIQDFETIRSAAKSNQITVTQLNYAIEKNKSINNKFYLK